MSDYSKIEYYDLRWEAEHGRLPAMIGRKEETDRLTRVINRSYEHHAIIAAAPGAGKSAFMLGWARSYHTTHPGKTPMVKLAAASLLGLFGKTPAAQNFFQEAFFKLKNAVVLIDDFGQIYNSQQPAFQHLANLLAPLLDSSECRLILALQPEELEWLRQNQKQFLKNFEIMALQSQPEAETLDIVRQALEKTAVSESVPDSAVIEAVRLVSRFPVLGNAPAAAIRLLDEAARAVPRRPRAGHPLLNYFSSDVPQTDLSQLLHKIVAEKTGVPVGRLGADEKEKLKNLESTLRQRVIGQGQPLAKIVSVIQRAKLGLRSGSRPLGSFLLLGPSGVGKTETAKLLAEELYGGGQNFLRVDMSEFSEPHTVQRLTGAPAGYIGYEEGGQLTNHFKKQPYSLLLLDEIEKSHPKVFDIFLQLLDDGRLTSGQGETVDMTQAIVIATSNLGVESILEGFGAGEDIAGDYFLKTRLMPQLVKNFRMEFLNRFDAILVYNPLSVDNLVDIALLEIKKIEQRVKEHNITFNISREVLAERIRQLADPRFGARPAKRFVEDTCETLITKALLK